MSRHLLILNNAEDRARARKYIAQAPSGSRIEVKAPKRSLPQNDYMWLLLTDVAAQATHNGRKYTPEVWKSLLMTALDKEMQFVPSLDNSTLIPLGLSTSDLSKEEMSNLIDFICAWSVENGVTLHGQAEVAA